VKNPALPECGQAISAVKALAIAQQEGQKIYTITPQNASTALAKLPIGGSVGQEIRSAVQAGKEVTIHEKSISAYGWSGYGYVIVDPETGAGGYIIEGGGNGGLMMLLGIIYMIVALTLFIAIGASTGGIGLLAVGSVAFFQFVELVISGVSMFMAGLALATGQTKICSGFMGVYVAMNISILLARFEWIRSVAGQIGINFASGYGLADMCS
jgi:hypothetical protein